MSLSREQIEEVVLRAVDATRSTLPPDVTLASEASTRIVAEGTSLDSLGIINLILAVEDGLRAEGLEVQVFDEELVTEPNGPFGTVASLVDHCTALTTR